MCTVLHSGHESLVLQGFLYNAFIFGCLTAWTMQSCVRFHFLAVPLAAVLLLVLFARYIGRVLHSPILTTVYACCGPLAFMGCAAQRYAHTRARRPFVSEPFACNPPAHLARTSYIPSLLPCAGPGTLSSTHT